MSDKGKMKSELVEMKASEIRQGAAKYVDAIVEVLEKNIAPNPITVGKELTYIGYAAGLIASKCGDIGMGGLTALMDAIQLSLKIEKRKEEIQYAVWEENGELHTSEEGWKIMEGGES